MGLELWVPTGALPCPLAVQPPAPWLRSSLALLRLCGRPLGFGGCLGAWPPGHPLLGHLVPGVALVWGEAPVARGVWGTLRQRPHSGDAPEQGLGPGGVGAEAGLPASVARAQSAPCESRAAGSGVWGCRLGSPPGPTRGG